MLFYNFFMNENKTIKFKLQKLLKIIEGQNT